MDAVVKQDYCSKTDTLGLFSFSQLPVQHSFHCFKKKTLNFWKQSSWTLWMTEVMRKRHFLFTTGEIAGRYFSAILCHFNHCNFPKLHHHRVKLFLYLSQNIVAEVILLTCWPWAAHCNVFWLLYSDGMFLIAWACPQEIPEALVCIVMGQ